MPCTTSSFTEVQIVAGKPWYPRNEGVAPAVRMASSAMASRSAVVTPGRTAARSTSRVRQTTSPARRIEATCSGVLTSMPRSRQLMTGLLGQLSETTSRASKMRWVTSATSPMPSTSIRMPRPR